MAVKRALRIPGKETPWAERFLIHPVRIVGAGPGAIRLLTLRAGRAIEAAEGPDLDGFARWSPQIAALAARTASGSAASPSPWSRLNGAW